jgi:hypothetical protein
MIGCWKGGGQWSAAFLVGLRANHRRQYSLGYSTQPRKMCRATVRTKRGFSISGSSSTAILRFLRTSREKRRRRAAGGGTRNVLPPGLWPDRNRVDCNLDSAFSMPGLRPYDEPAAGLAASLALVCGHSDRRGFVPPLRSAGTCECDQCPLWTAAGRYRMEKPRSLARAVSGIAHPVGLVGPATRCHESRRQQNRGESPHRVSACRSGACHPHWRPFL